MSTQKDLLDRAAAVRRKAYWKHGFAAIILIGTLIYMDILMSHVQTHLFITRIGLVLMNVAIFIYLVISSDLLYLWIRPNRNESTIQDHLQELIKLKQRQKFLHGRFYLIYYLLMMVGLLLSGIEYTVVLRADHAIIKYSVLLCWLLVFWFVVRPKIVRRHEKRIDTAIAELQRLSEQLPVSSVSS